ncbi:unnamed protein product [Clonostachys chloroleuca]|uniref:Uncharacterized protein n=1 Tax=Clonostachys chloroleuca TaxID=1926264 RepID=A0AA35QG05_9HYPO|nr:unnamed protein product [Clonostachys chloroleuca]
MTVISGNIGTNILKIDQKENREIPQSESPYQRNTGIEFNKTQMTFITTDRFDYASRVVSQSLQSSPAAWFWYGKTTWLVRFLDAFSWRTIWVIISLQTNGKYIEISFLTCLGLSTLENVRFWEVEESARFSSGHATK